MRDPFTWSMEFRRRYVPDRAWMLLAGLVAGIGGAIEAETTAELWIAIGIAVAAPIIFVVWPTAARARTRLGGQLRRLLLGPDDRPAVPPAP